MAIQAVRKHHSGHLCPILVADGGSENHALTIEELLKQTPNPSITKVIALKDIAFSNSPVEAINKIVKRYLRQYDPMTSQALLLCINESVYDYVNIRPHGSLNGFIPMEAYIQIMPDLVSSQVCYFG